MEQFTITAKVKLDTIECCNCGVIFAMPTELNDKYHRKGGSFYCPNGHGQSYTKTREMKLRHRLDQTEAQLERTKDILEGTQKSLAATKGHLTRTKKRVKAGLCTECNRHFDNLQDHMEHEHGTFDEKDKVINRHKA